MFIEVKTVGNKRMCINTDHIVDVTEGDTDVTTVCLSIGRRIEIKEGYWDFVNRIFFHVVEYRGKTDG